MPGNINFSKFWAFVGRLVPGPRIRCGAWRQEICAARSLGKRVFRDKIKIATKARKLHYFWKIYVIYDASSLFGLETTNIKAQCYVHKSPKHSQVKKEKLTTYMRSRAHLKSSRRYAYCHGQVEQADCENMLLQAPRGLALLT